MEAVLWLIKCVSFFDSPGTFSGKCFPFLATFKISSGPGAKYFYEDLLHPLARKLFLHLKEPVSHLQSENQCLTCTILVTSEIYAI